MRKYVLTSGALAAVFTMGLVACGDDPAATPATDTVTATDTQTGDTSGEPTDTTGTTDSAAPADTTPTNPCDPNPCSNPPAPTCSADGTKVVSAPAGTGSCTVEGTAAKCTYATLETPCTDGKICSGGACAAPGDPCDYTFDARVSYVTQIALASQSTTKGADGKPVDHCCFDFNDGDPKKPSGTYDDAVDNKLGEILALVAGTLDMDLNATIAEQISSGSLVLLLETTGVTDAANSAAVAINGFLGEDADDDLTNNASGTAEFTVNNSSFKPGTKDPLIAFKDASIASGLLTAGPTLFTLSLPIIEGAVLNVAISSTSVESVVAVGPNGQGLTMTGNVNDPATSVAYGAKLGGVVTLADLYSAINGYVGASCVKVNDDDGNLVSLDAAGAWKCAKSADVDKTACEDGDAATQVVDFCGALLAFVQPDVDADDDGKLDAVSIGIWLKATSATAKSDPACAE